MGQRDEQRAKQRENLLFSSLHLFIHRGYDGTTVRDIAQKAQVSAGLMFHYFPNKEAILKELVEFSQAGIASVLNLLDSDEKPLRVFEKLTAFILDSFREPGVKELFLFINQVKTFDSIPSSIKEILRDADPIIKSLALLEAGQRDGSFKSGDPRALSLAYWGALHGIAVSLAWFPDFPCPEPACVVDILRNVSPRTKGAPNKTVTT